LENIHYFLDLLWIPDPPEDHPFFDTNPEHDVEEADDVF
jgi:hypothetical protein